MNSALSFTEGTVIEKIKKLPVLPQVTLRLSERMQSPTATLAEIASLIQTDAGLSSKILKLANSSYYSIPGGVSDISKALQYLGFTTIAQMILTSSVLQSFKAIGLHSFSLEEFWKHSFAVGLLSEIASRSLQLECAKIAFIGGLLHDIGKLILLEIAPDHLGEILHHAQEFKLSFVHAEQALNKTHHTRLGVYLVEHWNLPKAISPFIEHHHDDFLSTESSKMNFDRALIAWANHWAHAKEIGHSGDYSPQLDHEAIEQELSQSLGLTAKQLDQIEKKFQLEYEKAGALLNGHT